MPQLTEGMDAEQIIAFALTRWELPWQWGVFADRSDIRATAEELGVSLHFGEPIRPGNMYLAAGANGPKLLTCARLGEACLQATTPAYAFDFSRCVLVREKQVLAIDDPAVCRYGQDDCETKHGGICICGMPGFRD